MAQQSFALLCALATVTMLACGTRPAQLACALAGLLAGLLLLLPLPGLGGPLVNFVPAQVALLLVLLAFGRLHGGLAPGLLCACGGLLAVVWFLSVNSLGYPPLMALALVGIASLVTVERSLRHPPFRSESLLDEASVLLLGAALAQLLVPEALRGWQSAARMQAGATITNEAVALAPLVLAGSFLLAGIVCAGWRRSRAQGSR